MDTICVSESTADRLTEQKMSNCFGVSRLLIDSFLCSEPNLGRLFRPADGFIIHGVSSATLSAERTDATTRNYMLLD